MAQNRDTVLLMTSKTAQIEEIQQRYIDALENRISLLESQTRNVQQSSDNTRSSVTAESTSSIDANKSASTSSTQKEVNGTGESKKKDSEPAKSKTLKDAAPIQAYSRFFGKVKILARRSSKDGETGKLKTQGEEEVINDVPDTPKENGVKNPENDKGDTEHEQQSQTTTAPITLTLFIDEDDYVLNANVKINDSELQALVQLYFAHYPNFGLDLVVYRIDSPFEPFIQYWGDLQALARCDEDHNAVIEFRKRLQHFRDSSKGFVGLQKRLHDFANSKDGIERTSKNLGLLLDLIQEAMIGRGGEQSIQEGLLADQDDVSFDNLWAIFKPGDVVISRLFLDEPQAFIVQESMESGIDRREVVPHWRLVCWSYDWVGTTFRRVPVELRVESFKGTRKIQSLSVYPIKYLPDEEKSDLEKRGRRFREICLKTKGSRLFQYSGDAILRANGIGKVNLTRVTDQSIDTWLPGDVMLKAIFGELLFGQDFTRTVTVEIERSEQVVVDALSFRDYGPGKHYTRKNQMPMGKVRFANNLKVCRCSICQQNVALIENQKSYYDLEPSQVEEPFRDSTQYLICPPRVLGYHLSRKHWVEMKVTEVQDIKQKVDTSAFDKLQMESIKSKELLRSLVMSHWKGGERSAKMQDLMKGKGEGLVVLLYGPPGVGKTLTAESVALATGRPLLFISVADIGLDPEKVEQNLAQAFKLAASWEAIILFDEADVFLESRSGDTASLARNALVSELLRVLEYFDGILILTTNRLRRFDHAVMSRVNLAVKYPELSHAQKKKILLNFVSQLDEDATTDRARIESWIRDEDTREKLEGLNGRQIRNILFSAARMTLGEEEGLSLKSIERVAQATKRFAQEIHADMEASRVKNEPSYRTM